MKRLALIPLAVVAGAAFAWADHAVAPPSDGQRVQLLHRNLPLIEELVRGGLDLAGEPEAIRRAARCNLLAEHLAVAVKDAVDKKESARAHEMGDHLLTIVKFGIADNLRVLSAATTSGSTLDQDIRRVSEDAAKVVKPVEERLEQARRGDPEEIAPALKAVRDGRLQLENAVKTRPRPPDHDNRKAPAR